MASIINSKALLELNEKLLAKERTSTIYDCSLDNDFFTQKNLFNKKKTMRKMLAEGKYLSSLLLVSCVKIYLFLLCFWSGDYMRFQSENYEAGDAVYVLFLVAVCGPSVGILLSYCMAVSVKNKTKLYSFLLLFFLISLILSIFIQFNITKNQYFFLLIFSSGFLNVSNLPTLTEIHYRPTYHILKKEDYIFSVLTQNSLFISMNFFIGVGKSYNDKLSALKIIVNLTYFSIIFLSLALYKDWNSARKENRLKKVIKKDIKHDIKESKISIEQLRTTVTSNVQIEELKDLDTFENRISIDDSKFTEENNSENEYSLSDIIK